MESNNNNNNNNNNNRYHDSIGSHSEIAEDEDVYQVNDDKVDNTYFQDVVFNELFGVGELDDEENSENRNNITIDHLNNLNDDEFEEIYYDLLPALDRYYVSDLFDSDNSEEVRMNKAVQDDIEQYSSLNNTPILRGSGKARAGNINTLSPLQLSSSSPSLPSPLQSPSPSNPGSMVEMDTLGPLEAASPAKKESMGMPLFTPEDLYATDRLLAAYVRTGLSLMTIGVGFGSRLGYTQNSLIVALCFFGVGIFTACLGSLRNYFIVRYIKIGYILPVFFTTIVLAIISLGLVAVSVWAVANY